MFSQSKGGDNKSVNRTDGVPKLEAAAAGPATVSALGRGMLVTGNIVCAGSMQISGRVLGDIHAAHVVICEGAHVEGNIVALETVVQGTFKGTIHANSVKLESTAVVDGEIFKQSLTIEQNAQFEGVSRRLEKPVEAPTSHQVKGEKPQPMADVVPISGAYG